MHTCRRIRLKRFTSLQDEKVSNCNRNYPNNMYIASLETHTTLNIYNLGKLALRGHLNTDA